METYTSGASMRPAGMRSPWIWGLVALVALCHVPSALGVDDPAHGATAAFANSREAGDHAESASPARPLQRPTRDSGERPGTDRGPFVNGMPEVRTVVASLAVVLALFFGVAWLMKKNLPKSAGLLPADVVQVLGRSQLAGRQFVHLVRCGNKLLLVNVTPGSAETLTEITDPVEVDRILGICAQRGRHSSTAAFQEVFQQLSRERSHG